MAGELQRLASTTIKNYGLGYEDALLRDLPITAALQSEDRIVYNCDGDGFDWGVKFKRATPVGNRGDMPLKFVPVQRFTRPYLDYRGFVATDSMTLLEKMKNRGKPALIKYIDEMARDLFDDIGRKYATQVWNNGNNDIFSLQGIESMFGQSGNEINPTTGAIQAATGAGFVMAPDGVYAGLDTDLGAYGGLSGLTGVWPNNFQATNDGDTADFFTPILVNTGSSSFNGSTHNWQYQGDQAIRFLITATKKDAGKKGQLDVITLALDLWRQLKDYYATIATGGLQRLVVENSKMRKLGFTDTLMIDGCEVMGQFGLPTSVGYGYNLDQMEYRSMFPKLFYTQGPEYHLESQSDRVAVNCLGNFQFYSPKYFGKLFNYTASGYVG